MLDDVPGADLAMERDAPPIDRFLALSGWHLVESRPDQVRAAPDRYWLARHRVLARDRSGRDRTLTVCVEAGRRPRPLPEPPSGLGERLGLDEVAATLGHHRVWAFPYDPDLPGLADAISGPVMRDTLRSAGLFDGPAVVSAQLLRYRPRRRAVVRYVIVPRPGRGDRPRAPRPGRALYGKVVRHDRGDRLRLLAAGPGRSWRARTEATNLRLAIPTALGHGLFVTPAMTGTPLRSRLVAGGSLPSPGRVALIPEAMAALGPPTAGSAGSAFPAEPDGRRHPTRLLEHAAGLLSHVLPSSRDTVARVADAVRSGVAAGWAPSAFVHGDLYDDQVFVDDRYRLGLIDLDDAGPGDPALDAANLCAHLLAMTVAAPGIAARLVGYRELVRYAFIDRLGLSPAEFSWREVLALLVLATGPFRVQAPGWPAQSLHLVELALRLTARPLEWS